MKMVAVKPCLSRKKGGNQKAGRDNSPLNPRQEKFVCFFLQGLSATESAVRAGFTKSYAKGAAGGLLKIDKVARAIRDEQAKLRAKTMFDVAQAFVEIDTCIKDFRASEHPNQIAIIKSVELKCKLSGLLVDKLEVKGVVDIRAAIEAGRSRMRIELPRAEVIELPAPMAELKTVPAISAPVDEPVLDKYRSKVQPDEVYDPRRYSMVDPFSD
jgi:hypothetical protein